MTFNEYVEQYDLYSGLTIIGGLDSQIKTVLKYKYGLCELAYDDVEEFKYRFSYIWEEHAPTLQEAIKNRPEFAVGGTESDSTGSTETQSQFTATGSITSHSETRVAGYSNWFKALNDPHSIYSVFVHRFSTLFVWSYSL